MQYRILIGFAFHSAIEPIKKTINKRGNILFLIEVLFDVLAGSAADRQEV